MAKKTKSTLENAFPETVKLADVASAAGVAVATASRALSNPNRVNAETRERVLQVAQELGYSINVAARRLRSGLSRSIMVVVPPWHASDLFETILHAIDAELLRSGYNMLVCNLGQDREADPRVLELARGGLVDGVLAIANDLPVSGRLSVLGARAPVVGLMVDLSAHGVPSVVSDDRHAVYELTRTMLAEGRRRFMYVSGPKGGYHDAERYAGFKKALAAVRGLPAPIRFQGDWSFPAGESAAQAYLKEKTRPDAIVFSSDRMAISFMSVVERAGVRVGKEVVVCGYDGIDVAPYCRPSLTTIEQSTELMGAFGARLLLRLIQGDPPASSEPVVVPSRLVRRESF